MISPVLPTYARAPLSFEKGEGPWLMTEDGDRYLDLGAGIAVNALGHAHPRLVAALEGQARRLWHTSNLYEIPNQKRLAETLVENTFADSVFFTNSGTEAMECAVKMARKYWDAKGQPDRNRMITFAGSFHGRTLGMISAAGGDKLTNGFGPLLEGFDRLKNLLVFVPMLAAHDLSGTTILATLLAFLAFSLVASSVYLLNDLLDLAADRAHPRKRLRPFASGEVPLIRGTLWAPGLLAAGVLIAASVGWLFLLTMVLYYVTTLAYSFGIKRRAVIDICALAGLYTLRIVAGGAATGIPLSVWLLAFSIFFFFALAAVKRQAELVDGLAAGRASASGRAYEVGDLPLVSQMALSSGYVSVLVMALYLNSPTVQTLYPNPAPLWGICLILLYWLSRVVMKTHRGVMHDDPVVFAVKDRVSLVCGALIMICALLGTFL